MKMGIIGLGNMGSAMAHGLLKIYKCDLKLLDTIVLT